MEQDTDAFVFAAGKHRPSACSLSALLNSVTMVTGDIRNKVIYCWGRFGRENDQVGACVIA